MGGPEQENCHLGILQSVALEGKIILDIQALTLAVL